MIARRGLFGTVAALLLAPVAAMAATIRPHQRLRDNCEALIRRDSGRHASRAIEDAETLDEAVGYAVGAASMCWEKPYDGGVFQSNRAKAISDALLRRIQQSRQRGVREVVAADLHKTSDAREWARAFVKMHGGDEDLMVGWFANMWCRGFDDHANDVANGVQ